MFQKIIKFALGHKIIAAIIILVLIFGGYFGYKAIFAKKGTTSYVTAAVEKGTLIVSVSGSGQVSSSDQVDIKSKVSGDVVYVGVKKGQEVKANTLLIQIDSSSAQKAVRDAETNLETAKLELDELLEPVDELTLLQAENSLTQLKESKQKAEDNLVKAYEDGFNTVVSAFFDLPTIMTDMDNILYDNTISRNQNNIDAYADMVRAYDVKVDQYKSEAADSYYAARTVYNKNFQNYKATSRYSDSAIIETLINETYEATKKIAEAVKDTDNLISFVKDILTQRRLSVSAIVSTHQSTTKTDTSKANSILSNLLSIETTIKSSRDAIISAERSIEEKELSLANLKAGADELTIRAKKIAIQQKEDALADAQQTLANHYIRAPFDGIIADINVKKGDSISSSAVATLITKQKIAEISLNEVDIAKVKTGQKANITFDAVEDLNITGEVAEVDTLGTATQGVITYGVKITFDTQDERVKPGMSVSVAIITDARQDVLLVSSSAIKQQDDVSYVEIMTESGVPQQEVVTIGLSNDTMTEIVNGLKEGDSVVTQTITANSSSTQQQGSSDFRMPGVGGGFGR